MGESKTKEHGWGSKSVTAYTQVLWNPLLPLHTSISFYNELQFSLHWSTSDLMQMSPYCLEKYYSRTYFFPPVFCWTKINQNKEFRIQPKYIPKSSSEEDRRFFGMAKIKVAFWMSLVLISFSVVRTYNRRQQQSKVEVLLSHCPFIHSNTGGTGSPE